ncbi:MAG TPA: potassium transporter TrkA [Desulfobulbaceae bacterium]|nr:potassium transporter TrkA [Desulfobulbaceae bacterium]
MKFMPSQLSFFLVNKKAVRNLRLLSRFFLILGVFIIAYSILFHVLMLYEGNDYSWLTGVYWTLTVMSTLGFGDITFASDLGRFFSIVVLLTGIVYLLVMMPFTFIRFFYAPWLEAQAKARTPRELPDDKANHVILTNLDSMTENLIDKLARYGYAYVILVDDPQKALKLHDLGYKAVVGDYGDPETYERLRVRKAALVVATSDDLINTSVTFTIRGMCGTVPIAANADEEHSVDILQLAGCTHVLQFMKMLGMGLGRRTLGVCMGASTIWRHGELLIAEAPAMRTALEGKTIAETRLREKTGVTVVGLWERGKFMAAHPKALISASTLLVLAGSEEQLKNFDAHFSIYCENSIYVEQLSARTHVLILGGGRVGNAAAEALEENRIPYKIVEKSPAMIRDAEHFIQGNAADIAVLHKAGIMEARSVLITTHNDDMNVYLTIYCRSLRPDIQIISRANNERTVSKLHRAGADQVMSYASMSANRILNLLMPDQILMDVEGLSIFRAAPGPMLAEKSLGESHLRETTGCSVVALTRSNELILNPDPRMPLAEEDELILIGTVDAEKKFMEHFGRE